ncbi:MAG: hypothetical protein IJB42_02390 [Oscillospiraceae bacterium]|nr:hypothetical protein [Oscillospiraceae bacterium]
MNLSVQDAIRLTVGFSKLTNGYLVDEPIVDTLACNFIEAGYASVDKDVPLRYCLTQEGIEILNPYITKVFDDFIGFIKKTELDSYDDVSIQWFIDNYALERTLAENLYWYFTYTSKRFGYEVSEYSQGKRRMFHFEKIK